MLTNEEVVRAYYAAVDRGVIDEVVDIFAPDAEYYRPGYPPMHGRVQLRNFYTNQRVLIGGQHIIELVVSNADYVSCYGKYCGKKRSGDTVNVSFADFHRVINGHIAERRTFFFAPAV